MEDDERAVAKMSKVKLEDGAANGKEIENTVTEDISGTNGVKAEEQGAGTPGSAKPRPSRKGSQRKVESEPKLFDHLPDKTEESCRKFQVIRDCLYGSKHLGSTDNDSFDCDCAEEWRKSRSTSVDPVADHDSGLTSAV